MISLSSTNRIFPSRSGLPRFGLLLESTFLLFCVSILVVMPEQKDIQSLSLIFVSIVLEALPFMLIGSLVGGMIEIFVSRERMTALLPKKHPWLAVILAAGLGIVFPVCECAVVPVVRRLARKGLPVGAAIAYLLGGPIVNPIVAASTALAYKFDALVVSLRLGLGYVIAVGVGLAMSRFFRGDLAIRADLRLLETSFPQGGLSTSKGEPGSPIIPVYQEKCHDDTCGCGHHHNADTLRDKFKAAFRHAAEDFLAVGHFLIIGAFIAALAQTFIDRKIFLDFAGHFGLPSILMMALAVLLNLCSEADAFIAASFRGLMPLPAQMAFLLTGPMFDLKLLLMYQGLFRKRAIAVLAFCILSAVLAVSLFLEFIGGILA
jgi:hypothetical protein